MTINPADWWGPEPKAIPKPTGGRLIRQLHDDEEDEAMPKGVYDRSKAKPRGEAPANDPEAPATPRKRGRKAKAAKKTGAAPVARSGKPRIVVEKGDSGFTVTFEGMTQEQVATLIATL